MTGRRAGVLTRAYLGRHLVATDGTTLLMDGYNLRCGSVPRASLFTAPVDSIFSI